MTTKRNQIVSAQVVLRSASGASPLGAVAVTSQNVREYLPSPSDAAHARSAFQAAGFEVGEVVGNSFSITAPASTFEEVFKAKLRRDGQKGVTVRSRGAAGEEGYELPVDNLTGGLGRHVAAAIFSPPPDFGPTGNF